MIRRGLRVIRIIEISGLKKMRDETESSPIALEMGVSQNLPSRELKLRTDVAKMRNSSRTPINFIGIGLTQRSSIANSQACAEVTMQ